MRNSIHFNSQAIRTTLSVCCFLLLLTTNSPGQPDESQDRPNILIAISDDQSWLHAGAYGDALVKTPGFDAVAANGALFNHAYTSAPSCTPSRATILTGQHHWRLGKGANLHSTLSTEYICYTELLEAAGIEIPSDMTGRSLLPLLVSKSGTDLHWRKHVVFGRERHTVYANKGRAYGARGIRTNDFLLIQNPNTNLWPAGQPPYYTDIDRGPSKYMFLSQQNHEAVVPFLEQTLSRRPELELYDCRIDPDQRVNLAQESQYKKIRQSLEKTLEAELKRLGDPRALGQIISWDRDPYHGGSYENWIETQAEQLQVYKKSRQL